MDRQEQPGGLRGAEKMPEFDPRNYPYPSRRNAVYARKAMACTSIPQGAQIGLDVMKAGGSAVDAAVAMAAAMPLLEPTSNGLGSDCFALVWMEKEKKLYGLNASGAAPAALSAERVRALGFSEMPKAGWIPTLVPGAPAGWAELSRRFGTKPLPELFAPRHPERPGGGARGRQPGAHVGGGLPAHRGGPWRKTPPPHAYWWGEVHQKRGALPGGGHLPLGGVRPDPGGAGGHKLRELLPGPPHGENCGLQPGDRGLLLRGGLSFLPPHVGGAHLGGLQGVHRL